MITILEAAKQSDITKQKVRYWIDLLQIPITKRERKFYIPEESVKTLLEMKNAIGSGLSPSLAAKEIKETYAAPTTEKKELQVVDHTADLQEMQKAIMLLVESNKRLTEDNKQLNNKLESVLKAVKKQSNIIDKLLPAPTPTITYKPWQPSEKKTPEYSFIKRFWYELVAPEKLRAN